MLINLDIEQNLMEEQKRVASLNRYSILDTLPEQSFDDLTALASTICATPISLISFVDADRQWFKSEHGLAVGQTPRSQSFCAYTVPTAKTMVVEDAWADSRFANNPLVLGDPKIRFYAGAPVIEPGGRVLGTICVIDRIPRSISQAQIASLEALARQVTALLELRLTISANEKAAEALRTADKLSAVGRLASVIAHEINNPLQSLTNLIYMAQASNEDAARADYLQQSRQELERVSHVVTQTLRFHRQSLSAAPAMLGEVMRSVLDLFRSRLNRAHVKVVLDDKQYTPLTCNASDLRQVMANLIGNAMDAVSCDDNGTITIRIRDAVSPLSGEAGIRITVADNGCGMSVETQANLFLPFFSTKGAHGTGLGLWVSKGILQKHRATVRVMSSRNLSRRGTAFMIFFPFA